MGDKIKVKLIEIDEKTGKYRLSHKVLLPKPEGYTEGESRPRGGNSRGPRNGGERRGEGRPDRNARGGNDHRRDRGPRNGGERRNEPRQQGGHEPQPERPTEPQTPDLPDFPEM